MLTSYSSIISRNTQAFLLMGSLLGGMLLLFPFQEEKVVFRRIQPEWRRFEKSVTGEIHLSCRTLTATNSGVLASLLIKRLVPSVSPSAPSSCELKLEESSFSKYSLITKSRMLVTLTKSDTGSVLASEAFSFQYPRPLCFLPILLFFVSLILGKTVWGLGLSFGLYVFMLFNFNLIHALARIFDLAELVVSTDKTWLGFTLFTFFLVLNRQEFRAKGLQRMSLTQPENTLNHLLNGAIGLWNPAFFSHLFTLFFKKTSLKRLQTYFDAQLLVTVLSLYLFSSKDRYSIESVSQVLFLPRYFSFALCLALFVTYGGDRRFKKLPIWVLPGFRRHLFFIAVMEGIALYWKPATLFPTLTRVAFALVLSQVTRRFVIDGKAFVKECSQPLAWIFLSALVSMMSVELGVIDLALVVFEPQAHPSVLTLFTYLSGIFLGVVTGSFSTAFFALVPALLKSQSNPIVRAALLDGILAGSLLSPFSLFTLLPAAMLGVPLNDVLRFRMRRLALPLLVGGIVYALSAVNSVAILRPVTFIFLCLVILVFKLHRNQWKMGKVWPWEIHLPKLDRNA